jgi:molybdenum cofactor cytidylyltransferase
MNVNKENIAILILAAGASTRMGEIKQLLPWGNTTLLNHTISQLNKFSNNIFLVLGANGKKIKPTVPNCTIVYNPNWENGMGTSIAAGVTAIEKIGLFEAALILLADQPLLTTEYYLEMISIYKKDKYKIVATSYGDKNGVPAILDASLFKQLKALNKDYGARKLMQKYSEDLKSIDPEGKAIDLDTPEVYQKLKKKHT